MQVGDLVMLSAYGKRLKSNDSVNPTEMGIIIKQIAKGAFLVKWPSQPIGWWTPTHYRNELRYAK